jgi:hypothetical protein
MSHERSPPRSGPVSVEAVQHSAFLARTSDRCGARSGPSARRMFVRTVQIRRSGDRQ